MVHIQVSAKRRSWNTQKILQKYMPSRFAIKICHFELPYRGIEPKEIFSNYKAPQMFMYVDEGHSNIIERYS